MRKTRISNRKSAKASAPEKLCDAYNLYWDMWAGRAFVLWMPLAACVARCVRDGSYVSKPEHMYLGFGKPAKRVWIAYARCLVTTFLTGHPSAHCLGIATSALLFTARGLVCSAWCTDPAPEKNKIFLSRTDQ